MRAAAQVVAYELAMGFAIIGVVMASGTLNMGGIIEAQKGAFGSFFWYMPPLFMVYFISGIAETNRAPFDVVEGESEIVAGFHVDYSGMAFALFFVAEYINMILISALTAVFFFGGWMSPLEGWVTSGPDWLIHGSLLWFWAKICFFLFCYLWFRATFPRYRYDQIMRLGWKVFIPITLIWLVVEAVMVVLKVGPWAHMG
jgi:NADH-quinone oxidoreductase subunit H